MKLKPRYHKTNEAIRVCYHTGHGWSVQEKVKPKGTREQSPWADITRRDMSLAQALEAMYRRYPVEGKLAQVVAEALS